MCITIILLCVGTFLAQSPYVKDYDISINKASSLDKLNIVMVSDIHLGNIVGKNRLSTMVDMINEQNPDIVLIAGDLIDENLSIVEDENMLPILKDIKSTYGTYMAFGNHDGYTGKLERLKNLIKENNVTVLEDSSLLINDDFYIIGKSCSNMTQKGRDVTEITSSIDPSKPSILISHIPDDVYSAEKSGIDLELCGHTHKGQLFPINLVTNMIFPIDYGFKKFGNTNVIVSSGYGTWGPPIRIGSRSEIVRITCTFNKK